MKTLEITTEIRDLFLNNNNFCEECAEKFGDDYRQTMSDELLNEEIEAAIECGDLLYYFPGANEAVEAVEENYRSNIEGEFPESAWSSWGYENPSLPTAAEHIAETYEMDFDIQTEFYLNLCAKMDRTL